MSVQSREVWQRLTPADQAEVVTAINHILIEVLDEHFRIGATTPLESSCDDVRQMILT